MEGQMRKRLIWRGVFILTFLFSSHLYAQNTGMNDGYTRMFGVSSRGAGMGGAMVGIADGVDAVAYNPAFLAFSDDSFSLGVLNFVKSDLLVNGENEGPQGMGLVFGLTRKVLRDRVGLGFVLSKAVGSEWSAYSPGTLPIPMGLGVGIKAHETLGIGIAPVANFWIRTNEIQVDVANIISGMLGMQLGEPATGVNPNFGLGFSLEEVNFAISVAFRPVKYVSLGYMNVPLSKARLRIPITILGGGIMDDMRMIMINELLSSPPIQQFGVGAYIPVPRGKLTIAWAQQWIGYGELYDELFGEYLKYTNPDISSIASVSYTPPQPKNDVTINRFGLEYIMDLKGIRFVPQAIRQRNGELAIRGGYFEWNSPNPEELYKADFDSNANVYSMGLGLSFDRKGKSSLERPLANNRFAMDVHLQFFDIPAKNYTVAYDYWGQPLSPEDYYYYHTEGQIWTLGLNFTWLH